MLSKNCNCSLLQNEAHFVISSLRIINPVGIFLFASNSPYVYWVGRKAKVKILSAASLALSLIKESPALGGDTNRNQGQKPLLQLQPLGAGYFIINRLHQQCLQRCFSRSRPSLSPFVLHNLLVIRTRRCGELTDTVYKYYYENSGREMKQTWSRLLFTLPGVFGVLVNMVLPELKKLLRECRLKPLAFLSGELIKRRLLRE